MVEFLDRILIDFAPASDNAQFMRSVMVNTVTTPAFTDKTIT